MNLFEFCEGTSPLHRRNPFIKLVALAFIALVVTPDLKPSTPWFDPGVPLVFLGMLVFGLSIFGHISLGAILGRLLPLGLLLMLLPVFGAFTFGATGNVSSFPISVGPFNAYREGFSGGFGLALRLLTYIACAMAYIMTTGPADFVTSLTTQLRIPRSLGYAILDRSRFLVILRSKADTMRAAHRLRGARDARGRSQQPRSHTGQLLSASAREAERASLARESRGFQAGAERTIYRPTPVTVLDWSFLMAVIGVTLVLIEVLVFVGTVDGFALGI
jgi:energy-coupling factor transport system permease protein